MLLPWEIRHHGRSPPPGDVHRRFISSLIGLATLTLGPVFAASADPADQAQLVDSINHYRSQAQRCASQVSLELPPLTRDPRLVLPINSPGDLQQALSAKAYPMSACRPSALSGPRDAAAAMKAVQESFCQVVLNPQFVDIGVNREGREWRIVLARPLLSARLGDLAGRRPEAARTDQQAPYASAPMRRPGVCRHHAPGLERGIGERR